MSVKSVGVVLMVAAFVYLVAASVVFNWRHPWATDAERTVWAWSAMKFERVSYEVMRPRGEVGP